MREKEEDIFLFSYPCSDEKPMEKIRKYRKIFAVLTLLAVGSGAYYLWQGYRHTDLHSLAEPLPTLESVVDPDLGLHPRLRGLKDWQRPEGPPKVALQVGHWLAREAPEEQINLRLTTGTSGGGKDEWEVAMAIALEAKKLLEERGIMVELLPTTIPPNYWADAFVSIHADGNDHAGIAGYKSAASRLDYTGRAGTLAELLDSEYGIATLLRKDSNITRSMRGYYAFNWRRYEHSLHPMTPAAIIETGFLTNPSDRRVIVGAPEKSALGIANAITKFLKNS